MHTLAGFAACHREREREREREGDETESESEEERNGCFVEVVHLRGTTETPTSVQG
jgi:hypothetical protein